MSEFFQIMALPFLTCLVLTGIHAYLGVHVITRQVIFVDLALAQIAVLGAGAALIAGHGPDGVESYLTSLLFTVIGAGIFALVRFKKPRVPQEAIVGIVYVVASAVLLIILNFSGEGTEHIRESLLGNILLISPQEFLKITIIYAAVSIVHFIFRRQFVLISRDPDQAFAQGMNVRGWDFLFYLTFGVVVTSSVKIAGVLLVFSFLVMPAVCAMLVFDAWRSRLLFGWMIGTAGSVLGIAVSYWLDLPTSASVVCALAFCVATVSLVKFFHQSLPKKI